MIAKSKRDYDSEYMFKAVLLALVTLPLIAAELAPTGTLRVAFLGNNPVQAQKDPQSGEYSGPVPDLVKELARRLQVPLKLLPAPNAAAVIQHVNAREADIGFLAYDAERAAEVDYSDSYLLMGNTYLVRADSPLQKAADVDRSGTKVGAVRGQSQHTYLSGALKQASVVTFAVMPSADEMEKLLMARELDAVGANRDRMEVAQAAHASSLRVLPDNFSLVEQAVIVAKDDPAKAAKIGQLNQFLAEMRKSGFVKTSIANAKLGGVEVAPEKTKR